MRTKEEQTESSGNGDRKFLSGASIAVGTISFVAGLLSVTGVVAKLESWAKSPELAAIISVGLPIAIGLFSLGAGIFFARSSKR